MIDKFMRNILLHVQAFEAKNEWQKTKYRQAQGIAVAKANGKRLGRPKKERTNVEIETVTQKSEGVMHIKIIETEHGIIIEPARGERLIVKRLADGKVLIFNV